MGNILVVDDDRAMRTILRSVLSKDFKVTVKNNGFEAMTWLMAGNVPDVIVSDIVMPYLDGCEFIQYIRQNDAFASVPIIVLSGHESEEVKEEALRYGAEKFFSKPFDPRLVLEYVLKIYLHSRLDNKARLLYS